MASYTWRLNSAYSISTSFDIRTTIDIAHIESTVSPIDQFIIKNRELNILLIDPNNFSNRIMDLRANGKVSNRSFTYLNNSLFDSSRVSPVLANLVLLGHISAVESYFRAIFRRLVLIDKATQKSCYEKLLSYGAVLFHDKTSLPDALLELISFSSKRNIEEILKEYFGIKGSLPASVTTCLEEFGKVCQMRHSIVHKFGILGVNNIKQDLSSHSPYVNKPIKNSFTSIQDISLICTNIVHEINQLIWQTSMMRLIADFKQNKWEKKASHSWKWQWKNDKALFKKYFDIFFSDLSRPPIIDMKTAYLDLENTYKTM